MIHIHKISSAVIILWNLNIFPSKYNGCIYILYTIHLNEYFSFSSINNTIISLLLWLIWIFLFLCMYIYIIIIYYYYYSYYYRVPATLNITVMPFVSPAASTNEKKRAEKSQLTHAAEAQQPNRIECGWFLWAW